MVKIITGTTKKPVSSEILKGFFQNHKELEGYLYIGYPILSTIDGAYSIDALWISPRQGIVIFDLVEGKSPEDYRERQDDYANKLEAKLKGRSELVDRRVLCVPINVVTFAPALANISQEEEDYPLCATEVELTHYIAGLRWDKEGYFEKTVSVIQAVSTLRKSRRKREAHKKESRGSKLKRLEDSIANLDSHQSRAVIETVEGVQRIRGLAGSGKTIVLAQKVAYLHAQHPEWKIAVTFNTRSLKGQLRYLINSFYIEQTSEEPDWGNIDIIHAWGAPGGGEKNGMYYMFCRISDVEYSDYMTARQTYGSRDPFGEVCKRALADAKSCTSKYDVILVDEAQDFSPAFLELCYRMLREPHRLVYAYDELQNLRLQSLPSPEVIFGRKEDGTPKVSFQQSSPGKPQQDIILDKCYRNSRPVLVTAHALGFGIYHQPARNGESGLIQMFDQYSLWKDIGYKVRQGALEDGQHVILERTPESSPLFLEEHSPDDDLVLFKSFQTKEEQDCWVAEEIVKNIREEELRHDDIVVINPEPFTTRKNVPSIREMLFQQGIQSHVAGVDSAPDVFFSEDNTSVVFTGIYRAKGNEAAMVYIIHAESCFDAPSYDLAKVRNQLFTAITRSKAWVRVVGIGKAMDQLIEEYQKVKAHDFRLDFVCPTREQRERMNVVNRDMSKAEKDRIARNQRNLAALIDELEKGMVRPEDFDKEQIEILRKLVESRKGQ